MGFWSKLFGESGSGAEEKLVAELRDAIREPGDSTERLAGLLTQRPDLNQSPGKPVFPIMLTMGMMITDFKTFPLILAALLHKPERLRLLLRHGASTEVKCAHGRTALHWAIAGEADSQILSMTEAMMKQPGAALPYPLRPVESQIQAASLESTHILLEAGANPNVADGLGQTPLHRACSVGGKAEHIRLLLLRGATVSTKTGMGISPLIAAAQNGLTEAVQLLLAAGADPNTQSTSPTIDKLRDAFPDASSEFSAEFRGSTALHWASARGFTEIVRLLIKAHADVDARDKVGKTPIEIAVACGSFELVEMLQAAGAKSPLPDGWQQSLLLGALQKGDATAIAPLLAQVEINQADEDGTTLLHRAIATNAKSEVVSLLLDRGANIEAADKMGRRAIGFAAALGADETIELLQERGADLKAAAQGGWQPLHIAAGCGKTAAVTSLLKAGADPNALDESGFTPLARAVVEGHVEVVKELLKPMQSESNLARLSGFSPLIIAAKKGHKSIVELILPHKPDLEARTSDGWTALHEAVVHGAELTRLLLQAGANVNASTELGYTPLHRAAVKGQRDVVALLVQHGADVYAKDAMGQSAREFAQDSGDQATIDVVASLM